MMTVHEVSKLSGVSIRALHHYDKIGLLSATEVTESGYRMYDEAALMRLQQIMLFKELQFSLKEIGVILDSPDFDRNKALEQQIELLTLRKEHIENLITLATGYKLIGVKNMKLDFAAFDTKKIDEYAEQAKASWGQTKEWKEYEEKSAARTKEQERGLEVQMMGLFAELETLKDGKPDSEEAIRWAKKLQDFITEHYYKCSDKILLGLGAMYAGGGDFTTNINEVGGPGAAAFAEKAIQAYCAGKVKTVNQ